MKIWVCSTSSADQQSSENLQWQVFILTVTFHLANKKISYWNKTAACMSSQINNFVLILLTAVCAIIARNINALQQNVFTTNN